MTQFFIPHLLTYGIIALDLVTFSFWSFELLPHPGPIPLAFLLPWASPLPHAAQWRSSTVSGDAFSLCFLPSAHLIQTYSMQLLLLS